MTNLFNSFFFQRACFLSPTAQKDDVGQNEKSQFTLPDGTTIEVCNFISRKKQNLNFFKFVVFVYLLLIQIQLGASRHRAPEVLFNPELIGEECEGVHEILSGSIQRSDMDLRRTLYQNIVLSGGSTLFRGFGDRLLGELKRIAPKEVKIKISAPRERLYSTWIG